MASQGTHLVLHSSLSWGFLGPVQCGETRGVRGVRRLRTEGILRGPRGLSRRCVPGDSMVAPCPCQRWMVHLSTCWQGLACVTLSSGAPDVSWTARRGGNPRKV